MTWSLTNAKGSKDHILPDNPNILFREWKERERGGKMIDLKLNDQKERNEMEILN